MESVVVVVVVVGVVGRVPWLSNFRD